MAEKIKIGGDTSGAVAELGRAQQSVSQLRGSIDQLSGIMQGGFTNGIVGAMGAVRGLWGVVAANPIIATVALLGLATERMMSFARAAKEQAAAAMKELNDEFRRLSGADLKPMERITQQAEAAAKAGRVDVLEKGYSQALKERDEARQDLARWLSQPGMQPDAMVVVEAQNRALAADKNVAVWGDRLNAVKDDSREQFRKDQDRRNEEGQKILDDERRAKQEAAEKRKNDELQRAADDKARFDQAVQVNRAERDRSQASAMGRGERAFDFIRGQLPPEQQQQLTTQRIAQLQGQLKAGGLAPGDEDSIRDKLLAEQMKQVEIEKKIREAKEKTLGNELQRGTADYLQDLRDAIGRGGRGRLGGSGAPFAGNVDRQEQLLAELTEIQREQLAVTKDRLGLAP
jgi:hypothetical protein